MFLLRWVGKEEDEEGVGEGEEGGGGGRQFGL